MFDVAYANNGILILYLRTPLAGHR